MATHNQLSDEEYSLVQGSNCQLDDLLQHACHNFYLSNSQ